MQYVYIIYVYIYFLFADHNRTNYPFFFDIVQVQCSPMKI